MMTLRGGFKEPLLVVHWPQEGVWGTLLAAAENPLFLGSSLFLRCSAPGAISQGISCFMTVPKSGQQPLSPSTDIINLR